jgi:hypothetical protein
MERIVNRMRDFQRIENRKHMELIEAALVSLILGVISFIFRFLTDSGVLQALWTIVADKVFHVVIM